jgi:DNA-3-methyladenine glycosylase I
VSDLLVGADGELRCGWPGDDPLYLAYHDTEWGRGVADDHRLYEKIVLEGFQAGLSWITVLRKRERFREVFEGFDPAVVVRYGDKEIDAMLGDPGIIRHRGKIESAIGNAARALEMIDEFGSIGAFMWPRAEFAAGEPHGFHDIPAVTESSQVLSRDLKQRGWSFVGPTTMYAFMQAMGLVDDHLAGCFARSECEISRRAAYAGACPGDSG